MVHVWKFKEQFLSLYLIIFKNVNIVSRRICLATDEKMLIVSFLIVDSVPNLKAETWNLKYLSTSVT